MPAPCAKITTQSEPTWCNAVLQETCRVQGTLAATGSKGGKSGNMFCLTAGGTAGAARAARLQPAAIGAVRSLTGLPNRRNSPRSRFTRFDGVGRWLYFAEKIALQQFWTCAVGNSFITEQSGSARCGSVLKTEEPHRAVLCERRR